MIFLLKILVILLNCTTIVSLEDARMNKNQFCGAGPFLTGSSFEYFFDRVRFQLL